ncbi:hypothetical protein M0R45_017120 [Rubus argutus]|uniref:Uncharacterized protein n=1 Tax=Rubus argutus TaxID=59490 RepID=A0AAW1XV94_RUBAR
MGSQSCCRAYLYRVTKLPSHHRAAAAPPEIQIVATITDHGLILAASSSLSSHQHPEPSTAQPSILAPPSIADVPSPRRTSLTL